MTRRKEGARTTFAFVSRLPARVGPRFESSAVVVNKARGQVDQPSGQLQHTTVYLKLCAIDQKEKSTERSTHLLESNAQKKCSRVFRG